MPEWLKGADCKSAGNRLRRFESYPHHTPFLVGPKGGRGRICRKCRGCSSDGRASAFQAEGRGFESRRPLYGRSRSSVVERVLGKDEVTGSSPVASSVGNEGFFGWEAGWSVILFENDSFLLGKRERWPRQSLSGPSRT